MKWILVLWMAMDPRPGLNPNVYLGSVKFWTHQACEQAKPEYKKQGYESYCVRGPLRWLTPEQWNASHHAGQPSTRRKILAAVLAVPGVQS